MHIGLLLERFSEAKDKEAFVWRGQSYSFGWLISRMEEWKRHLAGHGIEPGAVVGVEGDYSPHSVALVLALMERSCIVPLLGTAPAELNEFRQVAQCEHEISFRAEEVSVRPLHVRADHKLYGALRSLGHPGLVLFSSGSTGKSKGVVHDATSLLRKYRTRRHSLRTLAFLLFEHIGGVDTVLYCLSNTSCLVLVENRSPEEVCRAVAEHGVEVLPVSPSFLNLMLLSRAHEHHDLSSLKYITYGAEVMPESTLKRCHEIFPSVTLLQKFGTSEVGTLRSKSRSSDSLWFKMGGEGYRTRIVDGILQIHSESSMLGYLNAASPFTEDGWFVTGDLAEQDGEFVRILGRETDIINVGGEKVFPGEVESVLLEFPGVTEAVVYGEKNAIMGNIVCAKITANGIDDPKEYFKALKVFCSDRLPPFKVPLKFQIVNEELVNKRFKKERKQTS